MRRLLLALLLLLCACGQAPPRDAASLAGQAFLGTYLASDGRVVRHDQGGDTVSEGQGYAMLVAVALGDRDRFDAAWTWTREHLLRPDGLLSYLWRDGRVADPMAAADADVQVAWALALADDRWGGYGDEADRLADAVLDVEVVRDDRGHLLLAAGPWAVESRTVEPGYWTLPAYTALHDATGDARWDALARGALATLPTQRLPSDWATVGAELTPVPGPPGGPVVSGLDGQRAVVWLAVAQPDAAARWRGLLDDGRAAQTRALDGTPVSDAQAPLGAVAAAAADQAHEAEHLEEAARLEATHPTYYGSAWVALGRLLLTTSLLA